MNQQNRTFIATAPQRIGGRHYAKGAQISEADLSPSEIKYGLLSGQIVVKGAKRPERAQAGKPAETEAKPAKDEKGGKD